MWRVSFQDYRNWRKWDFKEAHPKVATQDYETREAAETAKAKLVADGLTACVSPTPGPRHRAKRPRQLDEISQTAPKRFNAPWKLHR